MKGSSKLLAEAQLDIKIERGLKILQFATQYNLRKSYLRNCTLNSQPDPRANPKTRTQQAQLHSETADIIAELNAQVMGWQVSEEKERRDGLIGDDASDRSWRRTHTASPPNVSRSISQSSNHSAKSGPKEDRSQESLASLSNYQSQATRKRLQSIKEESDELKSLNNSKSYIVKVSKNNQSQLIRFEDLQSIQEHNDSSVRSIKSTHLKVENSKKSNKKQEGSNFKKNGVHEHSLSSQINTFSESDFPDLKPNSRLPANNPLPSAIKPSKKFIQGIQSSFSSSQNSSLDKSISRIVSNSSQLKQKSSSSNISDFSLMRELSSSFVDGQNMKMLLKLENCELQESYLEKRIVSRLQKGYKQVNGILNITWDSLDLPPMKYGFQRPNYANLIE